ncbi:MAG: molybdopterin-dependent oxidoreductase [Actinobacteria bacterium]|nr:molybdopterin-dependent oxidoreductase [Actinomycetota bacterium]
MGLAYSMLALLILETAAPGEENRLSMSTLDVGYGVVKDDAVPGLTGCDGPLVLEGWRHCVNGRRPQVDLGDGDDVASIQDGGSDEMLWIGATRVDAGTGDDDVFTGFADDVLLADGLAGSPLTVATGGPLRLVAPGQYGYKSVRHVCGIEYRRRYDPGPARWLGHPRGRVDREERSRLLPGRWSEANGDRPDLLLRQVDRLALGPGSGRIGQVSFDGERLVLQRRGRDGARRVAVALDHVGSGCEIVAEGDLPGTGEEHGLQHDGVAADVRTRRQQAVLPDPRALRQGVDGGTSRAARDPPRKRSAPCAELLARGVCGGARGIAVEHLT